MAPARRLALAAGWLAIGAALPWLLGRLPLFLEDFYTPFVFLPAARALGRLGTSAPFSLAQFWILFAAIALIFFAVRDGRRLRREGRSALVPVTANWVTALAALVWVFHLAWGLHYAQQPFRVRTGLPAVEVTPERLARLTRRLAEETNRAHAMAVRMQEIASVDESSPASRPPSDSDLEPGPDPSTETGTGSRLRIGRDAYLAALERGYEAVLPGSRGIRFSRPKFPEPAGWLLTRFGISGIYFPFTGEASVNGRMPEPAVPFVAAHEMAHQRGIAREDEANALGYLACRQAGLWTTRYSGALAAYRRAWGALYRSAPDSALALAPWEVLDPGPEADRLAIRSFWQRHEGVASEVAHHANDTYLRANAQPDGVRSYGRMIDLLVVLDEIGMLSD